MKLNTNGFAVIGIVLAVVVAGILGVVGYKMFATDKDVAEPVAQQQTQKVKEVKAEPAGTVITSGDSEFGTMLFNENGQAIYIWELEDSTQPECYGNCAEAWPPVLTNGAPRAANAVNNELLGTTQRTDGSTQVTYNGHPLYYYAHEKPGEVECHNISTHGGLWWVVQPNGLRAA